MTHSQVKTSASCAFSGGVSLYFSMNFVKPNLLKISYSSGPGLPSQRAAAASKSPIFPILCQYRRLQPESGLISRH